VDLLQYIRSLKFEVKPDYNYIKATFSEISAQHNHDPLAKLDWNNSYLQRQVADTQDNRVDFEAASKVTDKMNPSFLTVMASLSVAFSPQSSMTSMISMQS
jgi:hypothetical protein